MLRTKVMLGLGCLLIIMFAMGLYSIDRCSDLGRRIEAMGHDHDAVAQAIGEMKRNCGAMTGALLLRATDGAPQSVGAFDHAWIDWSAAAANGAEGCDRQLRGEENRR